MKVHGLTVAKNWVQCKLPDFCELCHGAAMHRRPKVETDGKTYHNIAVGCSYSSTDTDNWMWKLSVDGACVCAYACMHSSWRRQSFVWTTSEIELWGVNFLLVPFLLTPEHRLISWHWLLCSLLSETIKLFVSMFFKPGFNLWYLSKQAMLVWPFLQHNYGEKRGRSCACFPSVVST